MSKITVMTVFGTRPEAIKMAPVVKELEKHPDKIRSLVLVSAQHREMLDQVLEIFNVKTDYDLNVMTSNQQLSGVTAAILNGMEPILQKEKVDFILVQGDTTTTFVASLIGFYHRIPVGHVEAGLRTHDMYYPFPEELNRVMTSRLATLHFAPTTLSQKHLLDEGVNPERVFVTGNTVIDAFLSIAGTERTFDKDEKKQRTILLTAHRRENWGKPLENICNAVLEVVNTHPDVNVIFPVHLNPNVQKVVRSILADHPRIQLMEPLGYEEFAKYIKEATLILTDSGGIQEEAPSLGKPVLVLRNETERQEAVEAGTVKLIGTNYEDVVSQANLLLDSEKEYQKMAQATNPFGDGKASMRIVQRIMEHFEID